MITRNATIRAIWTCEDKKGSTFKLHYVNVNIEQTYITKDPKEDDLLLWLDLRALPVIKKMCDRSCESLCDSCFCDDDSLDFILIEGPTQKVEIPAGLRANIVIMLERIKANLDNTDYVMFDLIPQLDKYLSEQKLTRDDIRDIIIEVGLEKVIK